MDSYIVDLVAALSTLNSLTIILTMLAGVGIGIVLGALPGFGSSQALALLFPVTFAMTVDQAVLFLIAVYSAVEYGSSIPAILIRTPGTGASAVTVLDGYAMARQGLSHRALRISLYSGVIGGTTSTIIFIIAGTSLGYVALAFGPGELFAVGVFGLAIVGGFFGKDTSRGFLAVGIGLLFATVGSSGFGGLRFTFNQGYLLDGIPLVVVIIGFLAGPEAFRLLVDNRRSAAGQTVVNRAEQKERNRVTRADVKLLIPTWIRGSLLGTLAGAIPGAGGSVGALLAYSEEKRWSKRPEKFGTGIPEGIAAPEVANNAVVAGTLVPSLSLGIPGSGGAAILLGVLISKGVVPGPIMFQQQGDFVLTVFIGLLLINLFLLIVGLVGTSTFSLVSRVPLGILGPFVLLLIVAGAYAYANNSVHIIMVLVLCAFAYLLEKINIPVVPVVLAFIMGPIIESNLSRALTITRGDIFVIVTRPITATILLLALAAAVYSFVSNVRQSRREAQNTN